MEEAVKDEILFRLSQLHEDFNLLEKQIWEPDTDSIRCSMANIETIQSLLDDVE